MNDSNQVPATEDVGMLLTINDVSAVLGISVRVAWRWVAAGRLPAVRFTRKVVRFRGKDLQEFIDQHLGQLMVTTNHQVPLTPPGAVSGGTDGPERAGGEAGGLPALATLPAL